MLLTVGGALSRRAWGAVVVRPRENVACSETGFTSRQRSSSIGVPPKVAVSNSPGTRAAIALRRRQLVIKIYSKSKIVQVENPRAGGRADRCRPKTLPGSFPAGLPPFRI